MARVGQRLTWTIWGYQRWSTQILRLSSLLSKTRCTISKWCIPRRWTRETRFSGTSAEPEQWKSDKTKRGARKGRETGERMVCRGKSCHKYALRGCRGTELYEETAEQLADLSSIKLTSLTSRTKERFIVLLDQRYSTPGSTSFVEKISLCQMHH